MGDKPGCRVLERRQPLDICIAFELVRVQKVEGGLDRHGLVDMVRPSGGMGRVLHHITTLVQLTGYAQEANLRVTTQEIETGYRTGPGGRDGSARNDCHDPRRTRWPRPDRVPLGLGQPSRGSRRRRAMDDPLTQGATMYNHYLFLALDTARQRTAEADRHRLAATARAGDQDAARGSARRLIAGIALA